MAKVLSKGERLKGAGKKGGTRFPNYSLKQLLPILKELMSKTHGKSITIAQINAGVFKIKPNSNEGGVKYSSLKQFGLAEGEYASINSTKLCSNIELSSGEEKIKFIREAFFNVPTFKNTFETYQGSSINKSKIKGYCISALKVHPDSSDKFVRSLLESAEVANVCKINDEEITFITVKDIDVVQSEFDEVNNGDEQDFDESPEYSDNEESIDNSDEEHETSTNNKHSKKSEKYKAVSPAIDIRLDSSLDPDKLEKQLKILRRFGLV